ncbi:MAG: diadenylate cyclase [Bacilli bacterium]|nr:diadenylate cyclase [Bacilli bacterium]
MHTVFNVNDPSQLINPIIGLLVSLLIFVLFDIAIIKIFNRKFVLAYIISAEVIVLTSWALCLDILCYVSLAALIVGAVTFLFANIGEARIFISNSMKGKAEKYFAKKKQSKTPEALFDREAMYAKIEDAVVTMSKMKVGALITFEKKDKLDQYIKTGTILNSPVSSELLQTIFYEGTRLHDGACVIRNNLIVAASVFFTPTNRPLAGKFGSRHRAAIGISESSDSVTVIVSEETGRISIAYDGELIHCTIDNFLEMLVEYMSKTEEKEEEE